MDREEYASREGDPGRGRAEYDSLCFWVEFDSLSVLGRTPHWFFGEGHWFRRWLLCPTDTSYHWFPEKGTELSYVPYLVCLLTSTLATGHIPCEYQPLSSFTSCCMPVRGSTGRPFGRRRRAGRRRCRRLCRRWPRRAAIRPSCSSCSGRRRGVAGCGGTRSTRSCCRPRTGSGGRFPPRRGSAGTPRLDFRVYHSERTAE